VSEKQLAHGDNTMERGNGVGDHLNALEAGFAADEKSEVIIVSWDGDSDSKNPKKYVSPRMTTGWITLTSRQLVV